MQQALVIVFFFIGVMAFVLIDDAASFYQLFKNRKRNKLPSPLYKAFIDMSDDKIIVSIKKLRPAYRDYEASYAEHYIKITEVPFKLTEYEKAHILYDSFKVIALEKIEEHNQAIAYVKAVKELS